MMTLSLWLASCANLPTQKLDADIFYRKDLNMTIDGKPYSGVAVVDNETVHDITFKPQGHLDLLLITTCHREDSFRTDQNKSQTFSYRYQPVPGIEDVGSCEMRINAYDKEKGQHSFGFIAFRAREGGLKAATSCNGEVAHMVAASVCEAKKGLIQRIAFAVPVQATTKKACPLTRISPTEFEYRSTLGECLHMFVDDEMNEHKHIVIGYEQVLVREID